MRERKGGDLRGEEGTERRGDEECGENTAEGEEEREKKGEEEMGEGEDRRREGKGKV